MGWYSGYPPPDYNGRYKIREDKTGTIWRPMTEAEIAHAELNERRRVNGELTTSERVAVTIGAAPLVGGFCVGFAVMYPAAAAGVAGAGAMWYAIDGKIPKKIASFIKNRIELAKEVYRSYDEQQARETLVAAPELNAQSVETTTPAHESNRPVQSASPGVTPRTPVEPIARPNPTTVSKPSTTSAPAATSDPWKGRDSAFGVPQRYFER